MLAILFKGLVEEPNQKKGCSGAARCMLGELLEHEDIRFMRTAGSKLE